MRFTQTIEPHLRSSAAGSGHEFPRFLCRLKVIDIDVTPAGALEPLLRLFRSGNSINDIAHDTTIIKETGANYIIGFHLYSPF